MDFSLFLPNLAKIWSKYWKLFLITGLENTLILTIISVSLGTVLGTLVAMLKMSRLRVARFISSVYVEVIRGTPILLQLYVFYFVLPNVFTFMKQFIDHLTERNFQNRTVGLIENGSWAPMAAKIMKGLFEKSKNITWLENTVTIRSAMTTDNRDGLQRMADELCQEYVARSADGADKHNMNALFRIGYGLYVVTSNDGRQDNGLIVNTVAQVSDSPARIAVTINKANYSHHVIRQTGKMNVNCLSVDAPFEVFETFGFQSGRNINKFAGTDPVRLDNGLVILPRYINAAISLQVTDYVDLGSHGMFICTVTEARVINDKDTMTYTYYQQNVKPKPRTQGKKGFVCKICGYIYEGDTLPEDFICPLCKHGAADFEPIQG